MPRSWLVTSRSWSCSAATCRTCSSTSRSAKRSSPCTAHARPPHARAPRPRRFTPGAEAVIRSHYPLNRRMRGRSCWSEGLLWVPNLKYWSMVIAWNINAMRYNTVYRRSFDFRMFNILSFPRCIYGLRITIRNLDIPYDATRRTTSLLLLKSANKWFPVFFILKARQINSNILRAYYSRSSFANISTYPASTASRSRSPESTRLAHSWSSSNIYTLLQNSANSVLHLKQALLLLCISYRRIWHVIYSTQKRILRKQMGHFGMRIREYSVK